MKEVLSRCLSIVMLMLICVSLFLRIDSQVFSVHADENNAGTFFASSYESDQSQVLSFTPMGKNSARLEGFSWKPQLVESVNTVKLANDTLNVSSFFEEYNVYGKNEETLALQIWLYFDTNSLSDITIGFESDDKSKKIEWKITGDNLYNLLKKDFNTFKYDAMFYSATTVPWGWNLISLPFSMATTKSDGIVIDDGQSAYLDLNNFYIYQDDTSLITIELLVYSLTVTESAITSISCNEKQAFCHVEFNDFENIEENYYVGEYYTLPSIDSVFKSIWIGDVNLLGQNYRNEQYYGIEVSSNGTTTDEYYGKAVLLENTEYSVSYMVGRGNGNFVALKRQTIKATSYGTGAWFIDDEVDINIGEEYELKYYVHEVFAGAIIEFESTDDSILEIVDVDTSKKVVKVKGIKKGEAGITISIYDDRLMNSKYEDGLKNENLVVNVEKESDPVSTVKVLLWISLGLGVAGLIYYMVIAIQKSRNIDVK